MRVPLKGKLALAVGALAVTAGLVAGTVVVAKGPARGGQWVTGDFHTHTWLTDGVHVEQDVVSHAFDTFGLDWMANSEHGGTSGHDVAGNPVAAVWRWITLKDWSFPLIEQLRQQYPDKLLVQGVEWNVPTHEHASVGFVTDEPAAVSDFEYRFDGSDKDTSRTGLVKQNATHADAVAAASFLQQNYATTSYIILNHPSRRQSFSAADIRDLNNAAPSVAFGLEGLPGHQKESARGGYTSSNPLAQTYGGADYMLAKVGGLMDSLWGEGRKFWVFVNSDFHNSAANADFWPGEYAKTYTWVQGQGYQDLVDGLRSGRSYAVEGDLIDGLEFTVSSQGAVAEMGQTLPAGTGKNAVIKIRFHSPATNNNGDPVAVDHIDLIAGDVTGTAQPGTAAYKSETNLSTQVIATFTAKDWEVEDGWNVITYPVKVQNDQYFRLRGTNLAPNTDKETDAEGNPLSDALLAPNTAAKAWADLWFYSNPVFVDVQP